MSEGGAEFRPVQTVTKPKPVDLVLTKLKKAAEIRTPTKLESQTDKQIIHKLEDIAAELQAGTEPYRYGNSPPFIVDLPTKNPNEVFAYLTLLHKAGIPAQITDKLSIVGISLSPEQTRKIKDFVKSHLLNESIPFIAFGTPLHGNTDPTDDIGTTVIEQDGVVDIGASHAMLGLFRSVSQNREKPLPWGGSVAMVHPGTVIDPMAPGHVYFERKGVGYIYSPNEPDPTLYNSERIDFPASMTTSEDQLNSVILPADKPLYNCDTIASTQFAAYSTARSLSARLKGNLTLNNTLKRAFREFNISFTDISTYGESQLLAFDTFSDVVHADRLIKLLYEHIKPLVAPTAEHTIVHGETLPNTILHEDGSGRVIYGENLPTDDYWSKRADRSKRTYPPVREFKIEPDGQVTIISVDKSLHSQTGIVIGHTPLNRVVISGGK